MKLFSMLTALYVSACSTIPKLPPLPSPGGAVRMGYYQDVLDEMWTRVGQHEIAVCFEADLLPGAAWVIKEVSLPWQTGDEDNVWFDTCKGEGWGHNHPNKNCSLSDIDKNTIAKYEYRFHVLWCGDGKFVTNVISFLPRDSTP